LARAAAVLALLAQLTLALAGFAEGRAGVGFRAHFDAGGTSTHYVHDEAVCAACQARSLHGVVKRSPPAGVVILPSQRVATVRPESHQDSGHSRHNFSRAPPPEPQS
jgi:hypothetical protein